jgi:nucleoside 2-deoxyribosyltransferase
MTNFDLKPHQICPIWGTSASVQNAVGLNGDTLVDSPRAGGCFRITRSAIHKMPKDELMAGLNAKLTTWLVEQRLSGDTGPVITTDVVKSVKQREFLTYSKKIDNFFKYLNSKSPIIGECFNINIQAQGGAEMNYLSATIEARKATSSELENFLVLLKKSEFIHFDNNPVLFYLQPKGWEYLDKLSKKKKINDEAFVAMWFDPSLDEVFKTHIEPALIECGYKSPFRISQVEHSDKIDDAIIAKINEASLVIVDLTCDVLDHPKPTETKNKIVEARGGVYFEAGYAMGLGIPIIWTCRGDSVDHIHFDLRQYNQIVWQKENNTYLVKGLNGKIAFKEALVNRISALRLNRNER